MKEIETEILVIGAGGAGMYAAITAAKLGKKVILADKSLISRGGATVMAQMTVAAAIGHQEPDHWTYHLADTIKSGQGLCDEELSATLCKGAVDRILEMKDWKTNWAQENNRITQVMAPGHRVKRCCYVDFLNTGPAVSKTLRSQVVKETNIKRISGLQIIDLIVKNKTLVGALGLYLDTCEFIKINTKAAILAAGGLTRIFNRNSASLNMGGDAYALALRAGAELIDMEFAQFFPIGHLSPRLVGMDPIMWDPFRYKLGGKLLNGNFDQFIENYGGTDGNKYTVSRDLASYAIIKEIEAGRGSPSGGVWLSFKHVSKKELKKAFGPIIDKLLENNIDLTRDNVEVSPIAHYHMGGIKVNMKMETRIIGLFAAGEAVGGANGANRLSGNAIPEALVFGNLAGKYSAQYVSKIKVEKSCFDISQTINDIFHIKNAKKLQHTKTISVSKIFKNLQKVMWNNVGVIRTEKGLKKALISIENLKNKFKKIVPIKRAHYNQVFIDWFNLRNSLLSAEAVCLAAYNRKESRGAHQMEDIPMTIKKFEKNQIIELNDTSLSIRWKNVNKFSFTLDKKLFLK